ncbi:MAG: hypothetical protein EB006_06705, partial [Betaproteobacteria bacterium]|nr:hypothetical protein [Betaproteobacteria bacterium]
MTEGFNECLRMPVEASQSSLEAVFLSSVVPLIAAQRNLKAQCLPSISGQELDRFMKACRLSDEASLWALCETWLARGISAES